MKLIHGDCLEEMKNIPDGSVDAIITDPPYQQRITMTNRPCQECGSPIAKTGRPSIDDKKSYCSQACRLAVQKRRFKILR